MESLKELFGANLRHQRKARRLTQAELAERVDLSTEMVSKIERGDAAPSFATVERLAEALEVAPVAFFGVGAMDVPQGARGRLLHKINVTLGRMTENQLSQAARMLRALIGS